MWKIQVYETNEVISISIYDMAAEILLNFYKKKIFFRS